MKGSPALRALLFLAVCATAAFAQEPLADRVAQEREQVAAAHEEHKAALQELDEPIQRARTALDRLDSERKRLDDRLELRTSERVVDMLLSSLDRFRRSRRRLEDRTLPQLYRDLADYQTKRARVSDRVWELERPLTEPDQRPDGMGAKQYAATVAPLLAALRAHASTLEAIELKLQTLEGLYVDQERKLTANISFVISRSYWVRTDPPVGPDVLQQAWAELTKFGREYAAVEYGAGVWAALGLLVLLALVVIAWRTRLKKQEERWNYRGGPFLQGLQRTLATIALTGIVPGLILLAANFLRPLDLPPMVAVPLAHFLRLFAALWFVRRFLLRMLRPGGLAVQDWKLPEDCAAQLRRAANLATAAALLFYVPSSVLVESPPTLVQVPRLLYALFMLGMAIALSRVVRRKGPLVTTWTGGSGRLYRLWTVIGPLLALFLFGVVGMHVLGFRLGGRFLMRSAMQTVFAVLVLAAMYALLRRLVEQLASRVRRQALEEDSGRNAAREQSTQVAQQLGRVVSVILTVVLVFFLAKTWDIDDGVRTTFEQVQFVELASGNVISLWSVCVAMFWLVAGHFVVSNLSAVYEFLVYPLIGKDDTGGRFVFMALSRYVILLIVYSAALLSLHFTFESIGWLLAAASVGLGFGLQEIVANFVSGLILLIERPLRVGDIITVGETGGWVERINIRATAVLNWERQMIIVPNKRFITEEFTNWTRNNDMLRRKVQIGVKYGTDATKVIEILRKVVKDHPAVLDDPAPHVFFSEFADSSLNFEIWFFAEVFAGRDALSTLRIEIQKALWDAEIEIPFPQRDLHIRSVDDDAISAALVERAQERKKKKNDDG